MKITLKGGREIELPFIAGATGYVAEKIEITADDIDHMRKMAMDHPALFDVHLMQLQARFPERRAATISPVPDPVPFNYVERFKPDVTGTQIVDTMLDEPKIHHCKWCGAAQPCSCRSDLLSFILAVIFTVPWVVWLAIRQ